MQLSVRELLSASCQLDPDTDYEIIVYDQCTTTPSVLSSDCFLAVLHTKLCSVFSSVSLLRGNSTSPYLNPGMHDVPLGMLVVPLCALKDAGFAP